MKHKDCEELFEAMKDYLDGTAKEDICRAIEEQCGTVPIAASR